MTGPCICPRSLVTACAVVCGATVLMCGPAAAGVAANAQAEVVPRLCPVPAPADTVRAGIGVRRLCLEATAQASSPEAAAAIRYAFGHLGAAYSQRARDSVSPPVYDCSSMVGRAFQAGGARLRRFPATRTWSFYPYLGWTGAYTSAGTRGTNLVRVGPAKELRAGDILIDFDGADPSGSLGNRGHAQIFVGVHELDRRGTYAALVIHSSGRLRVVPYVWGAGWFSNQWAYRYVSIAARPAK